MLDDDMECIVIKEDYDYTNKLYEWLKKEYPKLIKEFENR